MKISGASWMRPLRRFSIAAISIKEVGNPLSVKDRNYVCNRLILNKLFHVWAWAHKVG